MKVIKTLFQKLSRSLRYKMFCPVSVVDKDYSTSLVTPRNPQATRGVAPVRALHDGSCGVLAREKRGSRHTSSASVLPFPLKRSTFHPNKAVHADSPQDYYHTVTKVQQVRVPVPEPMPAHAPIIHNVQHTYHVPSPPQYVHVEVPGPWRRRREISYNDKQDVT